MTEENKNPQEATSEAPQKENKDFKTTANEIMDKVSEGAKKAGEVAGEALETFADGAKKAGVKAGEVLGDLAEGTKKATSKAGETAGDVMDTIKVGVRKVSEKAKDSVKIAELKLEINKLENANKKLLPEIGQAVLDLHAEGKVKDPILLEFCKSIEENNAMIELKKEEIETVQQTESE